MTQPGPPLFPASSRYSATPTAAHERADGTLVAYLRRRFLPQPGDFAVIGEYRIADGDRPDTVAAATLGDPTQWWRLCDANGITKPDELVAEPGATVHVTLPKGIPGATGV